MKMRRALACLLLAPLAALAANGDVDTTFGDDGIARTGYTDGHGQSACRPVVQPDRKILACGTRTMNGASGSDFVVARFLPDGALDPSFSFDGLAEVDFDGGDGGDVAMALALQPDGRIVIAGVTIGADAGNSDFAIARLTGNGSLDPTFGAGSGKTTVEFDLAGGTGLDLPTSIALQPDGRIVLAGSAETLGGTSVVAVARLLADGTRDSSFNLNGKVTFPLGIAGATEQTDSAVGVAIDEDGRVVLGTTSAYTLDGVSQNQFGAARLLPNGLLDADFSADGRTTIAFDPGDGTSDARCFALALQRDGRVVLAGYAASSTAPNHDMAIVRLLGDGSLDPSFGFGGRTLVAFDLSPSGLDAVLGVLQLGDGRLLLVGSVLDGSSQLAAAARLTRSGALDESFGVFGKRSYDFALALPRGQAFNGVALQGTQIVAAGIAYVPPGGSTSVDNILVRIEDDAIFGDDFD